MTTTPAAPKPSRLWLAPALIFALALVVRAVGLTWGLPNAQRFYSYHPDESPQQIVGAVFHLLQGDFNPHFFNYPSLTVYATWFFYQVLALAGLTTNAPGQHYPWDIARDVILAGRLFSVVCGAGTAALSYGIARHLGLHRSAILAGILVALLPGLVQHSHFATVDIPATFFVVWCVWLSLRAQTFKAFLVAALVAGLAAGTKYNAGLVAVVPMLGALLLPELKSRWTIFALAPLVALLGFLVSTPCALISPAEFWGDPSLQVQSGISFELLTHPRIGSGDIFQGTGNGWFYHLTFNLPFVMTWPLEILALIGIGFAARERKWWPILGFVGLFFVSLGLSQVRFMRYLFPLAPFLCIAAVLAAARLPKPKVWGAGLALMVVAALPGILQPFVSQDPRDAAARLIVELPVKSLMTVALAHNPWFYTPPLQPIGFNLAVPGTIVTGFDVAKLKPRPSIFVLSEFEYREALRLHPNGEVAAFLNALKKTYGKIEQFPHGPQLALPGRDFVPHDYLYPNPKTRVYLYNY